MNWEKFGYPLIVAGSLAGVYMLLRRPEVAAANPLVIGSNLTPFGIDPGSWFAQGDTQLQQYLAAVPDYPLNPGYVARATRNPLATDPASGNPYAGNAPGYITYNQGAPSTPYGLPNADDHSDCGCGCGGSGGCEPKCSSDCDFNAQFADSRGTCLQPEYNIPKAPMDITYWNIQSQGGFSAEP